MTIMQVSISSITIPPGQTPGTRLEGSKNPPPRDNHSVQKPSPRDKKLENFTNVSINSDTI